MKQKELETKKEKPIAELEKEVREHRAHLESMQFDLAAGKVKNIKAIKTIKKTIAQLLTLRRQKTTIV